MLRPRDRMDMSTAPSDSRPPQVSGHSRSCAWKTRQRVHATCARQTVVESRRRCRRRQHEVVIVSDSLRVAQETRTKGREKAPGTLYPRVQGHAFVPLRRPRLEERQAVRRRLLRLLPPTCRSARGKRRARLQMSTPPRSLATATVLPSVSIRRETNTCEESAERKRRRFLTKERRRLSIVARRVAGGAARGRRAARPRAG